MRVLILNPPFTLKGKPVRFSRPSRSPEVSVRGNNLYYPTYLAYLTGYLEQQGHDVKLIDAVANGWGAWDTLNYVEGKFDYAVLDTSTPSLDSDAAFGSALHNRGMKVALVGTHVSALPDEIMKVSRGLIDAVIAGEFEDGVRRFLEGEGGLIRSKMLKAHELNHLPFVSDVYKRHLPIESYSYISADHPLVTILTARGCPHNCSFCNIPFKNSYRMRSVDNVMEEFHWIEKNLPRVKQVIIEDDTFPVVPRRTFDFCDRLIDEGINLKWYCNARVDTPFNVMNIMNAAGCDCCCVGFESAHQDSLNGVGKKTTTDMQLEFVRYAKSIGLKIHGSFVVGLPTDTKEKIRDTIRYAKRLNPTTCQFYSLQVYPGQKDFEWAKRNGYLETEVYERWLTEEGTYNCVVSRPDLSSEDVMRLCKEGFREFYGPRKALELALSMRGWWELKRNIKGFKGLVCYLKG